MTVGRSCWEASLASLCVEERHAAGAVVLREGEVGKAAYVIVAGAAEVSVQGASGPVPLSMLQAGELFGEISLLVPQGTRQPTVTALTPLPCLSLPGESSRQLIEDPAEIGAAFRGAAA